MVIVVSVSLIVLILNAEGMLLPNKTPLLMVLVVLFIAGGTALNFVQIQRWRRQQVDSQTSLESSNNIIFQDRQRHKRHYKLWLIAMPVFYFIAMIGEVQTPLWMRILFTVFALSAYSYLLFLYKRTKRS
jgi:hypothetical protein